MTGELSQARLSGGDYPDNTPQATGYTGRRGAAAVDPQAHPQLEFRGAGTRGAGQSGVPGFACRDAGERYRRA